LTTVEHAAKARACAFLVPALVQGCFHAAVHLTHAAFLFIRVQRHAGESTARQHKQKGQRCESSPHPASTLLKTDDGSQPFRSQSGWPRQHAPEPKLEFIMMVRTDADLFGLVWAIAVVAIVIFASGVVAALRVQKRNAYTVPS
jgi:hypothetical protein